MPQTFQRSLPPRKKVASISAGRTRCTFVEMHDEPFGRFLKRENNAAPNARPLSETIVHLFLEMLRSTI